MKKRKFSLLLNIATICLCVCAIAIGVYSAKTASLSINGSISFTAANCRVRVLGTVTGANETVSPYQEESNVGKVVSDTATPWNVAVTFDTSNLEDGEIAKPIKIAFKMNNLSVSYGVFAQFDFSEEMQSNLNIDVDFTSSLSGYEVLYSADRLCVLDEDYTIDVTATVTLTPKSNENFAVDLEDDFSINFYKQPTATKNSTSGEYEYGNLIYAIDSSNSGYATAKVANSSVTGDIIVPPQMEIDGTMYKVNIYPGGNSSSGEEGDVKFTNGATISTVSLPCTITKIGMYDFAKSTIVNCLIPNSVTDILPWAFSECTYLKDISIPSTVAYINMFAFNGCTSLTNVIIPNGVKHLTTGVFAGCTNLSSITIPNSVTVIFGGALNCSNLNSIIFQGTTAQWKVITFNEGWNDDSGNYLVYCTDGVLTKADNE